MTIREKFSKCYAEGCDDNGFCVDCAKFAELPISDKAELIDEVEYQEEQDRRISEIDYVYHAVKDGTIVLS